MNFPAPTACAIAVAASLAVLPASAAASPAASDPPAAASEALAAGQRAYDAGDFERAAEEFERAYGIHPSPVYLYSWAQAVRNAGDCATAVELYQRFVDSGVRGDPKVAAEKNIERCQAELAANPEPETAAPAPPPEPVLEEPPPADDRQDATPTASTQRPDALGLGLLIPGAIVAASGVGVLAVGATRQAAQAESFDYDRFDELDAQIDRLHIAGGITLGIGAALAIAGAVRLGVVRRRAPSRVAIAPLRGRGVGAVLTFKVR